MAPRSMEKLKARRLLAAGGAILGSTAMLLAGCEAAPDTRPTPVATSPSAPGSTDPSSTPKAEFTPGATGKYSPEELGKLSEGELVDRFQMTGKTPEELAANEAQAVTAYLESGTTDEELAPYLPLTLDKIEQFTNETDDKYAAAIAEAFGVSDMNESTRIAHKIILNAYAMNRLAGKPYEDFKLGTTTVESATVTSGSFKGSSFKMDVVITTGSNYDDSVIGKVLGVGDSGHWYRSIQNTFKTHTHDTYYRSGDHFTTS